MSTVFGVITATNQAEPGPASEVLFTIRADMPEGVLTLPGQRPANAIPDDGWRVDASRLVGTWVLGYVAPDRRVRWIIPLFPDAFDCEEAT